MMNDDTSTPDEVASGTGESQTSIHVDTGRRRAIGKLAYAAPTLITLTVVGNKASANSPPGPPPFNPSP